MGILPLKKRVNRDKCSFATKQRMFGVFAIDEILRYRGSRIPGSPTLCHPGTDSNNLAYVGTSLAIHPSSPLDFYNNGSSPDIDFIDPRHGHPDESAQTRLYSPSSGLRTSTKSSPFTLKQ